MQLKNEEGIAEDSAEGWLVFPPAVVSDGIGILNGAVFFLEFKEPGQKPRPSQQLLHDAVPGMHKIIYHA